MNLFIDANIYLNFYHLSGEDIEELKKLAALVENGNIKLFSCPQLREEINRNRDAKISDAMKEFRKANFKVSFPAFTKHYEAYGEVRELLKDVNKKHSELVDAAMADVKTRKLAADLLISDLLDEATEVEFTDATYQAALKRFRMGNPPGKKKVTIGDEMNWEALLAGVPSDEDLMFVSGDGDYCSPIDDDAFHSFLVEEWKEKKNAAVHFYKGLSVLLKDKFPDIKLASDVKTAGLIEQLAASRSFAITHAVIASLSKQEFSKEQVNDLIEIPGLNSQVGWILDDADVAGFYTNLIEKYGDQMDEAARDKLSEKLTPANDPEPVDGEVPF